MSCVLFLVVTSNLSANVQPENTPEELKRLSGEGRRCLENADYAKALEYFIKAENIAKKINSKDLFTLKANIGLTYSYLSNYGEALGYLKEALYEVERQGLSDQDRMKVWLNLGVLYANEKDFKKALENFKAAYAVSIVNKRDLMHVLLAVNIAGVYESMGDFKEAQAYLIKVASEPMPERLRQMWKKNYAESFLLEGNLKKAQLIGEELLGEIIKNNKPTANLSNNDKVIYEGYVSVLLFLSDVYHKQNKIDLAILYAKKGLLADSEMRNKIDLYYQLSDLYFKKKQYDLAFKYKDSVIITKDSMAVLVNNDLFESNKVKLKVQEYEDQIEDNYKKQQMQQAMLVGLIVLGIILLVIAFLIYRALKNKIIRQNQEKIIVENNQEISRLELEKKEREHLIIETELEATKNVALFKQEQLKNKISEKNRELSAKTLYLSIRNELIEDAVKTLSVIPEIAANPAVSSQIKLLNEHLKSDAGWTDFINQFEKTNPTFLRILKKTHPALTGKDIRFICCVFMNLDTKEISNIFNITYNAANRRKYRIKEKMNIPEKASLYEYLLKLDPTNASSMVISED